MVWPSGLWRSRIVVVVEDSHITACKKRILETYWFGNAYRLLTSSKYDNFRWRMLEETGCLITADGSENKKRNSLRDCPTT